MYGSAALEPDPISVVAPATGASTSATNVVASPIRVLSFSPVNALLVDLNDDPFV